MGMASTASTKSLSSQSTEDIPPPPPIDQNASQYADAARRRLASPSRLSRLFSFSAFRPRSNNTASEDLGSRITHEPAEIYEFSAANVAPDDASIILNNRSERAEDQDDQDRFEWAVVYENQRGVTLFSIPCYSALSLLPTDPLAFTLPNPAGKRFEQPKITLSTYPLPDGDWHWVSRAWMIDMRSDTGIVQHDGFEYNWAFRRHNWRPKVGFLSAGGWVRRRRWIRLMMRPRKGRLHSDSEGSTPSTSERYSMTSPNLTGLHDSLYAHEITESIWRGDENDWPRYRLLMLRYGQDGRKIDLWKTWLGFCRSDRPNELGRSKGKQPQRADDDESFTSEFLEPDIVSHPSMTLPPRKYLVPVLRQHGYDLLQLFVYPDSRVQFLKLLEKSGLLVEFGVTAGLNFKTSEVDFWSYLRDFESSAVMNAS